MWLILETLMEKLGYTLEYKICIERVFCMAHWIYGRNEQNSKFVSDVF